MNQFEIEVANALRQLEIPAHFKGYHAIKTAMNYLHENPDSIYSITKELYPEVARLIKTEPSRVERAIRHAITTSNANDAAWYKIFGRVGPFTNGEFLATLNESIKVKMALEGKE